MEEKLNQLQSLLDQAKIDNQKFSDKGNSAAGTRIRMTMQEIKKVAQDIRVDVQDKKKSKA